MFEVKMPFIEGEVVIHPSHGPMRVTHIGDRLVRGVTTKYINLEAVVMQLRLSVPESRASDSGLRAIASRDRIDELLSILAAPSIKSTMGWSRRIKDYQERLRSGNVEALCFVIREIKRHGNSAPSSAEGQMLRRAMSTLSIEFSLALQVDEDEAKAIIEETVSAVGGELQLSA
ncbi:CarD family transcriptional regulator [Agreia sp. COWG]|uniref:CarD family transcriptional regulator n=1 Tax=Agreia sp. COWG TaxID=2773266 RepID=UPI0019291580|nr:CarD family transcriptional regulator [Agreia sp. COWG]